MAAAQGIRAGAAYVELYAKDNRLVRGLDAASRKLKAFGAGIAGIGAGVGALGAAALTPVVPALETLGEQSKLASAADAFGLTAEKASRLFGLMKSGGSDIRDATEGLVTFNQRIADAIAGTGEEAATLFRDLGVSARSFQGLDSADRFTKLLEVLQAVPDPAKRVQLLLKAVGEDTGKNLIPVLSMTAEQMQDLGDAFEESAADLEQAKKTTLAYTLATAQISRIWREVVAAVAPALGDLAEWVSRAVKPTVAWVRDNRELVKTAALVAVAVLGVGGALVTLGTGFTLAGVAVSGFVGLLSVVGTVIGLLGTGLAALLSPVGLVVAAVAGLGSVFATQTAAGTRMIAELTAGFTSFASTAKTAWGGIVDAVAAGDLALAARVALAAVTLEWTKAVLWWTQKWNDFKGLFVDGWHDVVAGVKLLFWDLVAWIARTFATAIQGIVEAAAWVADQVGLEDLARSLRDNFDFSDATINRNRDRIQDKILDDRLRRQREADTARNAAADGARADLERAAGALEDAVAEAARRRAAIGEKAIARKKPEGSSMDDMLDVLAKKVDLQGTFNAAALKTFGSSSLNERTARAVDEIKNDVKKLVAEAQHGGLVFA